MSVLREKRGLRAVRRRPHGLHAAAIAAACLAVSMVGSSTAAAAPFSMTQSEAQTIDGQDFDFAFSGLALSDGTDGILVIRARGDYQAANPTEFLTWDLDALGIGTVAGPLTGDATILVDNGVNDVEWMQSFVLPGVDLVNATSDAAVHVLIDLFLDDLFLGVNHLADTEFVEVTLTYEPIPEPSIALLLGLGLIALGRGRRG